VASASAPAWLRMRSKMRSAIAVFGCLRRQWAVRCRQAHSGLAPKCGVDAFVRDVFVSVPLFRPSLARLE
jgi:hypothetical protein